MTGLKVSQIGNSLGVILPKEVLGLLKAKKGDTLTVSAVPGGITLSIYNPELAQQVDAGREIAHEYRDTLRSLAK